MRSASSCWTAIAALMLVVGGCGDDDPANTTQGSGASSGAGGGSGGSSGGSGGMCEPVPAGSASVTLADVPRGTGEASGTAEFAADGVCEVEVHGEAAG